jgi:hypothetical protein
MKIGANDKFWVVTDAGPESVLEDICFETTLRGLDLQFRGGLSMDSNPTIFTKKEEALLEAKKRLKVAQFVEKIRNAEITEDGGA